VRDGDRDVIDALDLDHGRFDRQGFGGAVKKARNLYQHAAHLKVECCRRRPLSWKGMTGREDMRTWTDLRRWPLPGRASEAS
jgi:hypothetical protein